MPLNGNHTQLVYLPQDKMTKFSRLSRYGMTFKPLTENRGEELLTLYLEDFPARTLAQQEKEQELTENEAECGEKWRGSFAKWNQDSYSWKTHQCSLLGDLESFSETWPRWGLMRHGECWELQMSEQIMKDKESGSLVKYPTPTTVDSGALFNTSISKNSKPRPTLGAMAKFNLWPTPTAHNAKEAAYPSEYNRKTPTLATHAGGKLNPTWVEWLMGWPLGWTDLKPLETDKCHYVQQKHGKF